MENEIVEAGSSELISEEQALFNKKIRDTFNEFQRKPRILKAKIEALQLEHPDWFDARIKYLAEQVKQGKTHEPPAETPSVKKPIPILVKKATKSDIKREAYMAEVKRKRIALLKDQ